MLSHIAMASAAQSDSRRRASRRNHYLRDVLLDMCVLDDLTQVPDKYVAPEDLLEPETVSDSEDQPLDDDIVMETDSDDGGDDAGATETAPDTIDATGDDEQVIGEQVVVQPVVTEVDEEGATYVEL
ncbi:TPA: hypothetical protein N0F65_000307 [Lagenidium giganteum]|uniref:Uncharacterized protein n=1 Tax=Lagenidium giganteum TaxID=4803 RepID=A0AAV2ZBT7_9STRA|nr:TPA: hypothetical protein N0F65_000307 [Lagenidium giganteum]